MFLRGIVAMRHGMAILVVSLAVVPGCKRHSVPSPQPMAAGPAITQPVVLTSDESPGTLIVARREGITSAQGALVVPANSAAERRAPAAAALGPPSDAVVAALSSLTEEAQAVAPNPATLPFYDFQVKVDPVTGELTGHERIDYPNGSALPLDVLPLRIFANGGEARMVVEGGLASADDPSMVRWRLAVPVPPGSWAHVELAFHGTLPPETQSQPLAAGEALLVGPERGEDYGLFSRFKGGVALAEWLPMVAAQWHGDFDLGKPSGIGDSSFFDLSSFRGTVDLPIGYRVAVPGVVLGEELSSGRRRTTFALADARDIAVFASKDFRAADSNEGGVTVHSIYRNGQGEAGQAVLQTARAALACFTRGFGPYPYRSLVAVEIPLHGGAGGAEFPGLIAVGGFLYGEPGQLPEGLSFNANYLASLREFTVAHEVAHQWWALQVASNPREQPDVDEPLAQFSAAYYLGQQRGTPAMLDGLSHLVAVNYQAMRLLGAPDGPAARPTGEFASTAQYAGIIYGKAPFFFVKVAAATSPQILTRGLAAYFRAHRFGVAERGDYLSAMVSAAAGSLDELKALQHRWFEASTGDADLVGLGDPLETGLLALQAEDVDLEGLLKMAAPAEEQNAPLDTTPLPLDSEQTRKLMRDLSKSMGGLDLPAP
jgi:hypothetical protein